MSYEIHPSNKVGFNTKESYIVTRAHTSFLRIVGGDHSFDMMTATASEDNRGGFRVCSDRANLISAAVQIAAELGVEPDFAKDSAGREFVNICRITFDNPEKDMAEVESALTRFFEIFDSASRGERRDYDEMQQIYSALASDDSGGDVYLSDGVWLSSDGSVHDRGR